MDTFEPQPIQSFCSFLAFVGKTINAEFGKLIRWLPRYIDSGIYCEFPGFQLVLFPPDKNPFHQWYLLRENSKVCFLQGDFYAKVPQRMIRNAMGSDALDSKPLLDLLNELNGTFSGFVADLACGVVAIFVDRFGFDLLYHAHTGDGTWLSSSIWPLLKLRSLRATVSREAIVDMALLGYPLGNRTLLEDIFVVQPGNVVRIETSGSFAGRDYSDLPSRRLMSIQDGINCVRTALQNHVETVSQHVPRDRFVTTLTGGHDTRVVLNALLSNGVVPFCLIGTGYPQDITSDARRGVAVARWSGCAYRLINYTRVSSSLLQDSFVISEGTGGGYGWLSWASKRKDMAMLSTMVSREMLYPAVVSWRMSGTTPISIPWSLITFLQIMSTTASLRLFCESSAKSVFLKMFLSVMLIPLETIGT